MSTEELRKSLEQLRSEVGRLKGGNELIKQRVDRLISDLEHQLECPDDTGHRVTLIESLRKLTQQFEVDHPQVTGILNHIMVTLSNMGI